MQSVKYFSFEFNLAKEAKSGLLKFSVTLIDIQIKHISEGHISIF